MASTLLQLASPEVDRSVVGDVGSTSSALTTSGCNTDSIWQINRALLGAQQAIDSRMTDRHIANVYNGDYLYAAWFGAPGYWNGGFELRETHVQVGVFAPTRNIVGGDTFKCGGASCGPDDYGYVGGDCGLSTICLCNGFWDGDWVDSQLGTIVHEGSHYHGGTTDHVYGRPACTTLATWEPDKAVENADSYAYFSEDLYWKDVAAWKNASVLPLL
jgi:hypothetical protein